MPAIFLKNLQQWADNEGSIGLLEELCQRWFQVSNGYPEKQILWQNLIRELLPSRFRKLHFEYPYLFKSFFSELDKLPNFLQISKVQALLSSRLPGWANYPEKSLFCEKIIKFHSDIPHWLAGSFHQNYREDKLQLLQLMQEKYQFPDLWSCAGFLSGNGLFYPHAKTACGCWLRYSGDRIKTENHFSHWLELLTKVTADWDELIRIDKKLSFIFDHSTVLRLAPLCRDNSSCHLCPLRSKCHFYRDNYSEEQQAKIMNLIKLRRTEEIPKNRFLAFLAGERYRHTQDEEELLASFPNLTGYHDLEKLEGNNPHFTELQLFLQGLVELVYKTKLESSQPKKSSFSNSKQIAEYISQLLGREKQEFFYILILDNKNRVLMNHKISQGLLNKSLVHPREVFAPALELRAAAIVLVHNHPSGDTTPSSHDHNITKRLVEVGNLMGIRVLDHLIIGDKDYFSFVDQGVMPLGE